MTNNEYKSSLLKLLKRSITAYGDISLTAAGVPTTSDNAAVTMSKRSYYNQKFHEIFYRDEVVIDEESYNNFCKLIDDDMQYSHDKKYATLYDFYNGEGVDSEHSVLLMKAFKAINIIMEYELDGAGDATGKVVFTLPDNSTVDVWFGHNSGFNGVNCAESLYINHGMYADATYVESIAETYADGQDIPKIFDTSDATAYGDDILAGKTAYARGIKLVGTIANQGAVTGTISFRKSQVYTIPQGYHDGNGSVGISQSQQDKIIPENIRSGVTILGVAGEMLDAADVTSQSKTVKATSEEQTINPDSGYDYLSQVIVEAIKSQSKTVIPSETKQTITPDSDYDYLSQVIVEAVKAQTKTVTPSGAKQTITPDSDYDYLTQVIVEAIKTQTKSVTPSGTKQTITPDSGYDGLSQVVVNAMPYVESSNAAGGITVTIG